MMKSYRTYTVSVFCLFLGALCTLLTLIASLFPETMQTNVYLFEFRQLWDDWHAKPFIDIVLVNAS